MRKRALVTGAGGFMGGHLVNRLKSEGFWVRGVDLKYPEFRAIDSDEFIKGDLRDSKFCESIFDQPFDEIYQLISCPDMIDPIFTRKNDAGVMQNGAVIDANILKASRRAKGKKIFYLSPATYSKNNQLDSDNYFCSEGSSCPAEPDSEYGLENNLGEDLYLAYHRKYSIPVRIGRFQNIFGPQEAWTGGEEKALMGICRKVAESPNGGKIEIWGDGKQTQPFLYVDECLDGMRNLMDSEFLRPLNMGSEEMVTINDLVRLIVDIAGKEIRIKNIVGPMGGHSRFRDDSNLDKQVAWKPSMSLRKGLEKTYIWVEEQVVAIQMLASA